MSSTVLCAGSLQCRPRERIFGSWRPRNLDQHVVPTPHFSMTFPSILHLIFPTENSLHCTHHEGDDEDEGEGEADDEGDDAHHQERVDWADWAVRVRWGRRPEERGVEDEGPVGHQQEGRQDGDAH